MAHGAVCDTHGLIQGSDSAKPFVPFSGSPACVSEAASPWDGNQLAGTPNAILPTAQVLLRSPSPCCHGCDARNARDRGCLCRCRMPGFDGGRRSAPGLFLDACRCLGENEADRQASQKLKTLE